MTPTERLDWVINNHLNIDTARTFLAALGTEHTYQTFDDTKDRKLPGLAKVINGDTSEDVMGKLCHLNASGAGIFVTVNQTDGKGRRRGNMVRTRAIFADFDGEDAVALFEAAAAKLAPSIVVASSPTKRHAYWLINTTVDEGEAIQYKMPEAVGCDPGAKDITRVLRIPGFCHRKGDPVLVELLECHPDRTYDDFEIIAAFGLNEIEGKPAKKTKKKTAVTPSGSTQAARSAPDGYDPLDYVINERDEALLRSALKHVDAKRRDNWIAVAGALARCGDVGERIFCEWSATAGTDGGYVDDDDCIAKLEEMAPSAASNYPAIFTLASGMGWHREVEPATDFDMGDEGDDQYEIKLKATEYLIKGLLDCGVSYIAGAQGVGKTSLLVPLCSIITGELDGFEAGLIAPLPRHVIYICEDKGQVDRIRYALMHKMGMPNNRRFLSRQCPRRINEEGVRNMLAKIVPKYTLDGPNGYRIKPLVVFDTTNACFEIESENDSAQVGRIMSALKSQSSPVIVVGHLAKALNRAEFGALSGRGSGAWEADAQATGFIFKEEDDSEAPRYFGLKKVRFEPEFRELRFSTDVMTVTIETEWGDVQTERIRYGIPMRSSAGDRIEDKEARKQAEEALTETRCGNVICELLSSQGALFKSEIEQMTKGNYTQKVIRSSIDKLLESKRIIRCMKTAGNGVDRDAMKLAPPVSFSDD